MTSACAAFLRAANTKHFSKYGHLRRWQRSGSAATSSHNSSPGGTGKSLSEPSVVFFAHAMRFTSRSSPSPGNRVVCAPAAFSSRCRQR